MGSLGCLDEDIFPSFADKKKVVVERTTVHYTFCLKKQGIMQALAVHPMSMSLLHTETGLQIGHAFFGAGLGQPKGPLLLPL